MNKLTSRKFWISVAAFLASIGTSIAGLATSEPMVATVGIVCTMLAAAIYAATEAYVDGANVSANGTSKVITATSNSSSVVQAALQTAPEATTTETK